LAPKDKGFLQGLLRAAIPEGAMLSFLGSRNHKAKQIVFPLSSLLAHRSLRPLVAHAVKYVRVKRDIDLNLAAKAALTDFLASQQAAADALALAASCALSSGESAEASASRIEPPDRGDELALQITQRGSGAASSDSRRRSVTPMLPDSSSTSSPVGSPAGRDSTGGVESAAELFKSISAEESDHDASDSSASASPTAAAAGVASSPLADTDESSRIQVTAIPFSSEDDVTAQSDYESSVDRGTKPTFLQVKDWLNTLFAMKKAKKLLEKIAAEERDKYGDDEPEKITCSFIGGDRCEVHLCKFDAYMGPETAARAPEAESY
jgi:hypothetical protein